MAENITQAVRALTDRQTYTQTTVITPLAHAWRELSAIAINLLSPDTTESLPLVLTVD